MTDKIIIHFIQTAALGPPPWSLGPDRKEFTDTEEIEYSWKVLHSGALEICEWSKKDESKVRELHTYAPGTWREVEIQYEKPL